MDMKCWKGKILETARKISSKKYQEDTWFGKGDKVSSPEELYCTLFEDFLFEDYLQAEDNSLSESQFSLGNELRNKMNAFAEKMDLYQDPKTTLEDPYWREIRQTAEHFINSFE